MPGAKRAELWIQFVPVVLAGLAVPLYASIKGLGWTVPQFTIATLLTMDMVGGAITNATNTAKRWYHREGQGFQQHFLFIAIHATQLFLVAWFFCGSHWWSFFGILYGYLLVTAFVILSVPLSLQRPVAILCYVGSILINCYVIAPIPGLEWFVPVFFLKLLISHLLEEAPFV